MIVYMVERDFTDDHENIACYTMPEAAETRRQQEIASSTYVPPSWLQISLDKLFLVVPYEVLE